jgi:DNA-binding transcriptional regulator LsrR (DeoR family)
MSMNNRKAEALRLRLEGLSYSEIGARMGVSRQRIQGLVQAPKHIRVYVSQKADNCCEICGVRVSGGHIHHKAAKGLEAEDYNDIDNLQYLCISCHRKAHCVA